MNYYYKTINDGVVTLNGCNVKPDSIPEEDFISPKKYEELCAKFREAPENTYESVYYFDWETETYLPRERTEAEKVDWFVQVVQIGTVKLEDVPAEYKTEVESRLPVSEEQKLVDSIVAEVSNE